MPLPRYIISKTVAPVLRELLGPITEEGVLATTARIGEALHADRAGAVAESLRRTRADLAALGVNTGDLTPIRKAWQEAWERSRQSRAEQMGAVQMLEDAGVPAEEHPSALGILPDQLSVLNSMRSRDHLRGIAQRGFRTADAQHRITQQVDDLLGVGLGSPYEDLPDRIRRVRRLFWREKLRDLGY